MTTASPTRLHFLGPCLLIAALAALVFLPGLPGEFLFDDYQNIVNNTSIQVRQLSLGALLDVASTPQPAGNMRVLPNLTFAIDHWRAGGMDPATFKATNLLIHGLTAGLLAWLLRSVLLAAGTTELRARWLAPVMALAWAAHPLQVSAVLYVVQRMQTMGTLFLVIALLGYVQARRAQLAGSAGSVGFLVAILAWLLAMACKEDSLLFPAYTLALELTVLRFAASEPREARLLRRGYALTAIAGTAFFLLVVVPHYWSSNAYPGRDFSSAERLLTQGRVLCLYLWQILVPLPSHMPFYYDWLQPSRGLLQPWTTLLALVVLMALLAGGWWQRKQRPLFALGVLWFFVAHFMTSNVIGLELAFEHRNHFALVGALLATGTLLAEAGQRLPLRPWFRATAVGVVLAGLASATLLRAHEWRDTLHLSKAAAHAAPGSARAWIQLCAEYFARGGGPTKRNNQLDSAVAACQSGSRLAPRSLNSPALLLVLKTLRGDITGRDWVDFDQRIRTADRSHDNRRAITLLTYNARRGVNLDEEKLLDVFKAQDQAYPLTPRELAAIGDFVMFHLRRPERALPYYLEVMAALPADDPFADQLTAGLVDAGRSDLAERVQAASLARQRAESPAAAGSTP